MNQKFDIVPKNDELAAMQRDMEFHPAVNDAPQTLSRVQIEQFNRDGYLKGLSVFSDEEINEIQSYFDHLLEEVIAAGGDSYSISSAHLTYGKVHDILTNPKIVAYVSDLLGENIIGWGSHFFCKMPHDGKAVAWHQDASYWPLSPSKAVTVWLAIDNTDVDNGCMRFISTSHLSGHLTYLASSPDEHNVLNQTIENPEKYGEFIENELAAGSISLHSDLLLHGSNVNDSDRRRCGLTLRYCTSDVRADLGWNEKGVYVQGEDTEKHWSNVSRPERD